MHRKKILAVAVAGALGMGSAGVALAGEGTSNYTIYGKLYPMVSSYDYNGATRSTTPASGLSNLVAAPTATADNGQRSTVEVGNSRIGFRGSEGLGGGLTAIFQIEQRVRFDDGTGAWAGNRDSFIGLSSVAGTFKLGNMDTAYKNVGDKFSFLGISSGMFVAHSNVLARGPGTIDFHLRQPNAVMYESPKLVGIQVLGTWGKDEAKGDPGKGTNVLLNSYGVTWEMGPVYVALGHEIHKDFFQGSGTFTTVANPTTGTNVRSNDTATRGTVMLRFGETTLSLDLSQIELKETGVIAAGRFESYKNKRAAAGVEQKFGNITGALSVVTSDEGECSVRGGLVLPANEPCRTTGLDGRMINLGGMYEFSRRTQVFAIFSKVTNGVSVAYGTVSGGAAAQRGEDVTAIGVGVSHSF